MGALIAGVMISTFPYTLDVVAKVTSLRDFFVTLFFVGLGMNIPVPTWGYILWTIFLCLFLIGSRLVTVFPVLYSMRQGYRVSLLPAVNLCQMSELSLVLLALGQNERRRFGKHHRHRGVCLRVSRRRLDLCDPGKRPASPQSRAVAEKNGPARPRPDHIRDRRRAKNQNASACSVFRGRPVRCSRKSSANSPDLLPEIVVIDFNPVVHERLKQRNVRAIYGDITARDVLLHAGVAHAEIIICSLPNMVLQGREQPENSPPAPRTEPDRANRRPRRTAFGHSRALRGRRQLCHRAAPARSRRPAARHRSRREKTARRKTRANRNKLLKARNEVIP